MRAHRAPVFKELYPNPAFYDAARRDFETMLTPRADVIPPVNVDRVVGLKIMPRHLLPPFGAVEQPHRIVPEATGNITTLLLTVPKFLDEHNKPLKFRYERYPSHFSRLLAAFGSEVKWVIVSSERELPFVKEWLKNARIPDDPHHVAHVDSPRFDYSIWAQDPYLVLRNRSLVILCEGVLFNREEDMTIADDVDAQVDHVVAAQSYLFFQGGNLLGGKERTLIGADYVWRNTKRFGIEREAQVIELFRALTGTDVLSLGGLESGQDGWHRDGILTGHGFQPIFHIDMYVTPTGVRSQTGREIVFLSRPRAAYRAVGKWSEVPYLNDERIDAFFDETHQQLSKTYEVRELPLLSTKGDLGGKEEFVRNYFLTWGNALVEVSEKRKRVVLPAFVEHAEFFGMDRETRRELQKHAEQAWRDLGFTVDVIDGLEDLAWGDGSIHCITKVLSRS